jgi:hypothetical protein
MVMNESISMREVRQETRIATRREATLELLNARFPGGLPAQLIERIESETDVAVLARWLVLAGTAVTLEAFMKEISLGH